MVKVVFLTCFSCKRKKQVPYYWKGVVRHVLVHAHIHRIMIKYKSIINFIFKLIRIFTILHSVLFHNKNKTPLHNSLMNKKSHCKSYLILGKVYYFIYICHTRSRFNAPHQQLLLLLKNHVQDFCSRLLYLQRLQPPHSCVRHARPPGYWPWDCL